MKMVKIEYFDENWGVRGSMKCAKSELENHLRVLRKGGYVVDKIIEERVCQFV